MVELNGMVGYNGLNAVWHSKGASVPFTLFRCKPGEEGKVQTTGYTKAKFVCG